MSLGLISPVEFKKLPCRRVDFRGLGVVFIVLVDSRSWSRLWSKPKSRTPFFMTV